LRTHDIGSILNVAFDLDDPQHSDIGLYKVGLCDGPSEINPVANAVAVLSLLVAEDKPVLVHCHAGNCRSPLVVALYMCNIGYSLERAMKTTELEYKPWMKPYIADFQ
jgi:protein-tyrosine phosphatase